MKGMNIMHTRTVFAMLLQICTLMLISCETIPTGPDISKAPNTATPIATPEPKEAMNISLPDHSTILPAENVEDWWWYSIGFQKVGKAWTPQPADVIQLEAGLDTFLRSTNDADANFRQSPPIWERLPTYKRQYFGIIDNNQRIIFANFFCDDFGIDFHQELVVVDDGGDCFFGVKFDLETGIFFDLYVNGEA